MTLAKLALVFDIGTGIACLFEIGSGLRPRLHHGWGRRNHLSGRGKAKIKERLKPARASMATGNRAKPSEQSNGSVAPTRRPS